MSQSLKSVLRAAPVVLGVSLGIAGCAADGGYGYPGYANAYPSYDRQPYYEPGPAYVAPAPWLGGGGGYGGPYGGWNHEQQRPPVYPPAAYAPPNRGYEGRPHDQPRPPERVASPAPPRYAPAQPHAAPAMPPGQVHPHYQHPPGANPLANDPGRGEGGGH